MLYLSKIHEEEGRRKQGESGHKQVCLGMEVSKVGEQLVTCNDVM